MIAGLFKRLVVLIVTTAIAGGIAAGAIYVQGIPIRAAQEQTAALFGGNESLCAQENLKSISRSSVNLNGRIGVVNAENMRVWPEYQDVLPEEMRPAAGSELSGVLCLRENRKLDNTEYYGANRRFTCTQYVRDLQAYLFDVSTKKVVAYRVFEGTLPADCPSTTRSNITREGNLPPADEIGDWLK